MATYYVNDAGSGTAPYDTVAKGATTLDTAQAYFQANGTEASTIKIVDNGSAYVGFSQAALYPFALTIEPYLADSIDISSAIECTNVANPDLTFNKLHITSTGNCLTVKCATLKTITVSYCRLYPAAVGIANANSGAAINSILNVDHTVFSGGTYGGALDYIEDVTFDWCVFYNQSTQGVNVSHPGAAGAYFRSSVFYGITGYAVVYGSGGANKIIDSCLIYDCDNTYTGQNTATRILTSDPEFTDLVDFVIDRDSPCFKTGSPSQGSAGEPYGGIGVSDMGIYGNTASALIPSWAIPVGFGEDFGNYFGGYISNEELQCVPHVDESYIEFKINRISVAYVDLTGTDVATTFVNTAPTGNPAATSIDIKMNDSGNKIEFHVNGILHSYIDAIGKAVA